MVVTEYLATTRAELCGGLVASFLVFLQLGGASKSSDVAYFYLLACLHPGIDRRTWSWRRLCAGTVWSLGPCLRASRGFRVYLGLWT